jgi:hypothetical protein
VTERTPEALPPDVAGLVELERQTAVATEGARVRVAARLGLEGAASAPGAPVGAGGWGSFVAPLTILTIAAAGAAVWLSVRSAGEGARAPERPQPAVKLPVIAPVAPPPPAPAPAVVQEPQAVAARVAGPDGEVSLLAAARKELAAGNPRGALALLRRHERRWPRGELVQEREVMAIQALAASGAAGEVRARADRFLQRFPGSTLSEAVRQARADSAGDAPGP